MPRAVIPVPHRVRAALAGMLATMAACAAVAAPSEAATRVMPLGDSITHGYNVPGGYRIALEDRLVAAGLDVDFVGSQANGPSELADRQHEGYPGRQIHEISDRVEPLLARQRPEVVLLLIGTNDMIRDHQLATAPQRLSTLIDRIAAGAPGAPLLVASLPTLLRTDGGASGDGDRRVRAYNAAIPDVVAAQAARGRRVSFVDMYPALSRSDIPDRVHPDRIGYDKMAAVWESALRATLRPAPPAQPVTPPHTPPSAGPVEQPVTSVPAAPTPASQVAPAPGTAPVPATTTVPGTPAAAGPGSRVVRVARQALRMDPRGRLRVRVRCLSANKAPCRGSMTLERSGRRLAAGRFSVRAGRASGVRLRLTGGRRRSVGTRAIRVIVRTRIRNSAGDVGVTRTRTRATLRRAPGRA